MNKPTSNRLLGVLIFALVCYLGLYTWNARTGHLDTMAERSGLEIIAYVLTPFTWAKDSCVGIWNKYVALIDVAEENTRLRDDLKQAERLITLTEEERAELKRLRELLAIEALQNIPGTGARVLSMQFGPHALLKTMTVNKGYLHGALVGTPVIAPAGVVGKVHRSGPHASTVLLLTDPGFRALVISQKTRTPGILKGSSGNEDMLEMHYVAQNAAITEGELIITSGADGNFPKGIPIGIVTKTAPGTQTLFMQVTVKPLVQPNRLEEVILLLPSGSLPPLVQKLPAPSDEPETPQQQPEDTENQAP